MFPRLRRLAGETLIYGLSGAAMRLAGFVLVPVYARLFGPEEFGIIALVGATTAALRLLVVLSLDNSAHRWFWDTDDIADRKATLASWAWCQLPIATLAGGALFAAADPLAQLLVGRADAGQYMRLAALNIPVGVLGTVLTTWLRVQRRAIATVVVALVVTLANLAATLWLVVGLGWGLAGVYVGYIVGATLGSALAVALMRDWLHPRHFRGERLRAMLGYALPLVPAALAGWATVFVDRFILQLYLPTTDVGLFQVAATIAAVLGLATVAFQQAWGPFALSIHRDRDAASTYADALIAYVLIAGTAATVLSLLAREAVLVVATEPYLAAAAVVPFLAFAQVLSGLAYIAALGPSLARSTAPVGAALTAGAAISIAVNLLLIPRLGIAGAGVAALAAQGLPLFYLFARSQRLHPIPYRFDLAGAALLGAATLTVLGRWARG